MQTTRSLLGLEHPRTQGRHLHHIVDSFLVLPSIPPSYDYAVVVELLDGLDNMPRFYRQGTWPKMMSMYSLDHLLLVTIMKSPSFFRRRVVNQNVSSAICSNLDAAFSSVIKKVLSIPAVQARRDYDLPLLSELGCTTEANFT